MKRCPLRQSGIMSNTTDSSQLASLSVSSDIDLLNTNSDTNFDEIQNSTQPPIGCLSRDTAYLDGWEFLDQLAIDERGGKSGYKEVEGRFGYSKKRRGENHFI